MTTSNQPSARGDMRSTSGGAGRSRGPAEAARRTLTRALKAEVYDTGFDFCRVLPVQPAPHAAFFEYWVDAGEHGEMGYLARNQEKRRHPGRLAEAGDGPFRSLIVLGVDYHQFDLPPALRDDPSRGVIAKYAWGDDYHEIIRPLLYGVDEWLRGQTGRATRGKCLVDTGPVLERDWAHQAGLGFTGKNCCTIHPVTGSWLFLATLLTPEVLAYDPPIAPAPSTSDSTAAGPSELFGAPDSPALPVEEVGRGLPPEQEYGRWLIPLSERTQAAQAGDGREAGSKQAQSGTQEDAQEEKRALGTCGRCTRCLTACPTDAFVGPFHLDARRCISYWTIETQSPIPRALRPHFGNRIFGCDICQEVCPWNQRLAERRPRLPGLAAHDDRLAIPLLEGFAPETPYWLDADAFSARFRRSPIKRAKRHGMARNICVALGNWGDPTATAALELALQDAEPVVRGHAAWALGEIRRRHHHAAATALLAAAQEREEDPWVREEIGLACA